MTQQHTPGPWHVTYNKRMDWWTIHHNRIVGKGETKTVCIINHFEEESDDR